MFFIQEMIFLIVSNGCCAEWGNSTISGEIVNLPIAYTSNYSVLITPFGGNVSQATLVMDISLTQFRGWTQGAYWKWISIGY